MCVCVCVSVGFAIPITSINIINMGVGFGIPIKSMIIIIMFVSFCVSVSLSVCVLVCLCVKRASGMYEERLLQQSWRSVNHICLSADASMHANQDALLGISWSWELNQACYASIQNMVPGKNIYEHEDLLAPVISIRAAENKVERVAAYRQLQATSHMLERLVGRGLSDFFAERCMVVGNASR